MKARVVKKTFDCVLSIGMIVKNEQKYLDDCLTALKPLLDAVSSELIIVDTGSTDDTVEIAKRHTDKVYFFEWIGDFAAARNFGLEKAVGEWFMFLDADEIFDEDMGDIISFFANRERNEKYNSARYELKNYSQDDDETPIFHANRITRRKAGLKFKDKIHEFFSSFSEPICELKTFANHYGYAYESEEQKQEKSKRNLIPLFEELKKRPNNLKIRFQILKEYKRAEKNVISDFSEDDFYADTLTRARKQWDTNYAGPIFVTAIINYYGDEKYNEALPLIDEYFKLFKRYANTTMDIDVYVAKAAILDKQGRDEEALAAYDKYFELYELYKQDKLPHAGYGIHIFTFTEEREYRKLRGKYSALLSRLGKLKIGFTEGSNVSAVVTQNANPENLKKLEDSLESTRIFYNMFETISEDELEEHVSRSLNSARKWDTYYCPALFLKCAKHYVNKGDFNEALNIIDEYEKRFNEADYYYIDLYYYKASALRGLGKTAEAVKAEEAREGYLGLEREEYRHYMECESV